jgi:4-diphosphocytidyl-2-C-methyl-D-erythritol kinase
MIGFPHAKINLGLSVIAKRSDGFHDLESVFYPIPLRDVLEIIPAKSTTLNLSGAALAGDQSENLVSRAMKLLQKDFPQISSVDIFLYKGIPSGAGLGGGSSDAAGMLHLLNQFFSLNIDPELLRGYALQLGSDCVFFLQSSPCYVSGRGEKLEPVDIDLSAYSLLLVHPGIAVSTAWAYGRIKPAKAKHKVKDLIREPVQQWRHRLTNDFEPVVFEQHPELLLLKQQLYDAGALYAAMTGSGSSLFGIFEKHGLPSGRINSTAKQTWLL